MGEYVGQASSGRGLGMAPAGGRKGSRVTDVLVSNVGFMVGEKVGILP